MPETKEPFSILLLQTFPNFAEVFLLRFMISSDTLHLTLSLLLTAARKVVFNLKATLANIPACIGKLLIQRRHKSPSLPTLLHDVLN